MGERLRDSTFECRWSKVLALLLLPSSGLVNADVMTPLRVDPALLGGRSAAAPSAASPVASSPGTVAPAAASLPEITDGHTTVRAQQIRGLRSVEVMAEGQAEMVREDLRLTADRLSYNELTDEINVEGNVRFEKGDDVITSERGRLVVYERTGEFVEPEYAFTLKSVSAETGAERTIVGHGNASMVRFEGENQYVVENATWTTCKPETPDWYIKAGSIALDYDAQVGVAKSGSLVFKGVPLLYWPSMSFPLGDQRKSGFLVPTVAASESTGFDLAVPYYWNIAPNYDLTLVPRLMSKRGMQLGAEARYLGERYEGQTRLEWLANDKVTGEARGLASIQHRHQLSDRLRASLNFNGVTDDEYFEDLSSTLQVSSRRNLLREGRIDYGGGWWNASARAQSYQTLRDDTVAPYKRMPQLTLNARQADLPAGLEFGFESEYVNFQHRDDEFNQGKRMSAYPQLAINIRRPGWYVKPKIGAHYTRYDLDDPLNPGGPTAITRSLPIFSLDAGMYFDRESRLFGRETLQTLEPRLYYVRIPYEDQSDIPLFDTSRYDFGFAQIFSENRYSGIDRIGDANQITAALTTRLIESGTGIERMRATVAQRFYMEDRRVSLGSGTEVLDDTRTDLLATFSGRIFSDLSLDLATQYSPEEKKTQRTNVRLRFQPEHLKVLNLGYRYLRGDGVSTADLRDVDISGQWPLGGRWYGVGRVTRSLEEKRTTEALLGLEYVSRCGCWAMRTAIHRFAINPDDVNTALFFQLELTGLGGIGSNPSSLIRRSVPGYGVINEPVSDPYFGN
jgi:LPS-assembly protein